MFLSVSEEYLKELEKSYDFVICLVGLARECLT